MHFRMHHRTVFFAEESTQCSAGKLNTRQYHNRQAMLVYPSKRNIVMPDSLLTLQKRYN